MIARQSMSDTVRLSLSQVNHRPSLDNVADSWAPEVHHFMEGVPIVLVGTKVDLRNDPQTVSILATQGQHPVTPQEGDAMARQVGARRFLECSAKEGRGVQEVFAAALTETLSRGAGVWRPNKRDRKKKCVVL